MAGPIGALTAWLEGKKRMARRNIEDILERPDEWGEMAAARWREDLPKQFESPESGLDFVAGPLGALAGVIKQKGGNWLKGSMEKALAPLKREVGSPGFVEGLRERLAPDVALNQWVEGPLTKYVKTQMATPEDPVRALAEQGVLHYVPGYEFASTGTMHAREAAGFPRHGMGKSDLARGWEADSDMMIESVPVEYFRNPDMRPYEFREPWMDKLPEGTPIYNAVEREETAGLNHLTDELRNALNPESGLPRDLQLRPEQLQQMGMEKAVRHVAKINEWRAAQKAAADAELAGKASVVREYAENNPKGLRWVELRAREINPPEGYVLDERTGNYYDPWNENVQPVSLARERTTAEKELAQQLKYEGDVMGHCVGGYCPDVVEGRSRIFSLRDAKGEPHVTIEVAPEKKAGSISDFMAFDMSDKFRRNMVKEVEAKAKEKGISRSTVAYDKMFDEYIKQSPEWRQYLAGKGPQFSIVQIKGKQNLAPKEEYVPFVQDFIRNSPVGQGGWLTIGDIGGARMHRLDSGRAITDAEARTIHADPSHPDWAEVNDILQRQIDDWEPYAEGGLVRERPAWWDQIDVPE